MKVPLELAQGLVRKATHDLIAARRTLPEDEALDTVCFHCQQAVEKCLKALLIASDMDYPLTHDLGILAGLLSGPVPEIDAYLVRFLPLTRYGVQVRYDIDFRPERPAAEAALSVAEEVAA